MKSLVWEVAFSKCFKIRLRLHGFVLIERWLELLRSEPLSVARVAFAVSELGDRKRIRT